MRREKDSGFSLVEVMIGVAVFAIVILAIGQAAMMGQAATNEVEERTNVLLGCQQIMDQLLTYPLDVLMVPPVPAFSIRLHGPDTALVPGGLIVVDSYTPSVSGISSWNQILRVKLYYKKGELSEDLIKRDENLVLSRLITLRQ